MRQLIIARKDLQMSPGKLAAQVSHASMAFLSHMIRNGGIDKRMPIGPDGEETYYINIEVRPDIYNDWLCGIFTKTICEAKNRTPHEGRDYGGGAGVKGRRGFLSDKG